MSGGYGCAADLADLDTLPDTTTDTTADTAGPPTPEQARDALADLAATHPEAATRIEDAFLRDVLAAITGGCPDPGRMARDALVVVSGRWARWSR